MDPESFARVGPTLTTFFFLVDEGRDDPNTTIRGPTSARQQTPLKWRFTVVTLMVQHFVFCLFVFVALRPMSTAMVIAGRSVHLTTLFPGQA